jgi:hypothetical protein
MINHVFSVLCNKSSIDIDSNTVSILEVLEQLTIFTDQAKGILLPIHFELFSLLTRAQKEQPAQGQLRINFCDPSGARVNQQELAVDLSSVIFFRTRTRFNGLELNDPGIYKFVVELKQSEETPWVEVAQLPLLVIYQPPSGKK